MTLAFLEKAVDFRALDGEPVRILFSLLAPSLRSHLHLLYRLGFALRDPGFRSITESEGSREEIYAALARLEGDLEGFSASEPDFRT